MQGTSYITFKQTITFISLNSSSEIANVASINLARLKVVFIVMFALQCSVGIVCLVVAFVTWNFYVLAFEMLTFVLFTIIVGTCTARNVAQVRLFFRTIGVFLSSDMFVYVCAMFLC